MANPNYQALVAFVAEKSLSKKMHLIWSAANPLLAVVMSNQANFNRGFTIEGHKALLPINFAEQTNPADGVSDANELTPEAPYATSGFTQAAYEYSHYRRAMYLRDSEKRLIAGQGVRANIIESKTSQLMESFKLAVVNDMMGTGNSSREAVMGLQYALSTVNSPGGISQATYPVWAAGRRTGAGPFHLGLVDNEFDRISALDRGKADLLLLSYTANNNVYGKMRDSIAPSQLLTNPGTRAKYGFVSFEYLEMMCAQDNRLGNALPGSFSMLRSGGWYAGASAPTPKLAGTDRLPGTDADEYMFNWWLMLGTNDPATNSLVDGIE